MQQQQKLASIMSNNVSGNEVSEKTAVDILEEFIEANGPSATATAATVATVAGSIYLQT